MFVSRCFPASLTHFSARSSVVKYLLQRGASKGIRSSGRFRLHTNPKKTLSCTDKTALEFAQAMIEAEQLSKKFDDFTAVADLSLDVHQGEYDDIAGDEPGEDAAGYFLS